MADNKKAGRQPPWEKPKHQVVEKGPDQTWSSVGHITGFLCAVLPRVFSSKNSSTSLLWENNHGWLSHLDTMRTYKYTIRKMRGAVQPTFRFICYSYNFNIQFCFQQCNLNSCTDRRLANITSSFLPPELHPNLFTESEDIQALTWDYFLAEAVTTGFSWKELAVARRMNKCVRIIVVQVTFRFEQEKHLTLII